MGAKSKIWLFNAVLVVTGLIFLSAVFMVASILYGWSWSDVAAPPLLGNKPENISRLTDGQLEPKPFSFFVIGDTRTSGEFRKLYIDASRNVTPDFGFLLGDFVFDPELNRHRFFMMKITQWGMKFPLFLIAGNHDAVTTHQKRLNRLHDPIYVEDFENLYGPTNFSFTYRGCLFIGLNDAYRSDYLDYLKDTLAHRPPDVLMIFVFMHIGPKSLSPLIQTRQMEGEEEFKHLMEVYNVDYVFAGDFHSYFRAKKGHTNYIITGGGGSPLRGGSSRGFYHALLIMVDPAKVQVDEVIYSINRVFDPINGIKTNMMCGVYPIFEKHPFVWMAVFFMVLAVSGVLVVFLVFRIVR